MDDPSPTKTATVDALRRMWAALKKSAYENSWAAGFLLGMALLSLLFYNVGVAHGWSWMGSLFFTLPIFAAVCVVIPTVGYFGAPEQKREAAAAFTVYGALALFTAFAMGLPDQGVKDKFTDALMFGQVIPLLSLAKLCVHAWAAPAQPETLEQKAERRAEARAVRHHYLRKDVGRYE